MEYRSYVKVVRTIFEVICLRVDFKGNVLRELLLRDRVVKKLIISQTELNCFKSESSGYSKRLGRLVYSLVFIEYITMVTKHEQIGF